MSYPRRCYAKKDKTEVRGQHVEGGVICPSPTCEYARKRNSGIRGEVWLISGIGDSPQYGESIETVVKRVERTSESFTETAKGNCEQGNFLS